MNAKVDQGNIHEYKLIEMFCLLLVAEHNKYNFQIRVILLRPPR